MSNSKDTRQKSPNVPTLRFRSFANDWEESSLGKECFPLSYGIGAKAVPFDGIHRYLRITDIGNEEKEFVSPDFLDEKAILKSGDLLLARTGATVGRSYLYQTDGVETFYAGFLIRARSKVMNPYFLYCATQTDRYLKWVKTMSARSGQPGINAEEFSSFKVYVPAKEEANKIASFLFLVDRRIAVQNKIIKELNDLMIALCKSMTIGPDATLAEVCECRTSTIKESVLLPTGKYPVYGATGLVGYLDTYDFERPGLAVIKDGAGVGRNYPIAAARYSIISTMALLLPRKDISMTYLWASLQATNFSPYVVGSGIPHIYFKDYKQSKIPNHSNSNICLSELAELIRKKRDGELEILSKMLVEKTYLLGNMFI